MTSRSKWRRVGGGVSRLHGLRVQSIELIRPLSLDAPSTHSMARRGAMSVLGVGWQGLVRFITNALVGRVGGPAVLGVVGSAISAAQLSTLAWPTSAGAAASKFVARARGAGDQAQAAAVAAHLARRTVAISGCCRRWPSRRGCSPRSTRPACAVAAEQASRPRASWPPWPRADRRSSSPTEPRVSRRAPRTGRCGPTPRT